MLAGQMPPAVYLPLHPSARLLADEKRSLAAGLAGTVGSHTAELDAQGVGTPAANAWTAPP